MGLAKLQGRTFLAGEQQAQEAQWLGVASWSSREKASMAGMGWQDIRT